jgi:hypothetical protein
MGRAYDIESGTHTSLDATTGFPIILRDRLVEKLLAIPNVSRFHSKFYGVLMYLKVHGLVLFRYCLRALSFDQADKVLVFLRVSSRSNYGPNVRLGLF